MAHTAHQGDIMNKIDLDIANMPDTMVDVRKTFGIDVDLDVIRIRHCLNRGKGSWHPTVPGLCGIQPELVFCCRSTTPHGLVPVASVASRHR